ncbi:hypothetical protein R5R35_012948 [Gryllus longicercus]|uniref:MADF domain-containing protein n=1 Tax=Gryllus longicercus TaxID=2509291 RepID=A0AAN9W119_9ORTH
MSEEKTWTNDEILSLISSFEKYPELGDTKNDGNKNKSRKDECWKELGEQFSCTDKEVHRKMHNLRTQFSQEYRKVEKKKNASGANATSKWKFYSHLTFLIAGQRKVPPGKNMVIYSVNSEETSQSSSKIPSPQEPVGPVEKKETVVTPITNSQLKKRKGEDEDKIVRRTLRVFEEPTKDRFSTFGEFVAAEVRNLKSPKYQNGLMREIQESIIQWSQLDDNVQSS